MMSTEGKKIWMDGKLVDFADAKIHVLSHSLHYGVAVFEGIRGYPTPNGTAIFRLPEHVRRLMASAHIYRMPCPYTDEEVARAIVDTQVANDSAPSYIRPILLHGDPALGVKNQKGRVSLAIAAIPAKKYLGADSGAEPAKISPYRKPRSDSIPSVAKADGNYLNGYLAGIDAAEDGYEEAILLDDRGFVAEGTGENIFLAPCGTAVYTPGLESDILLGITRESVREIASDLGYSVTEKVLSVNDAAEIDALAALPLDVISIDIPAITSATYQAVMGVDGPHEGVEQRAYPDRAAAGPRGRQPPLLVPIFTKCRANLGEMESSDPAHAPVARCCHGCGRQPPAPHRRRHEATRRKCVPGSARRCTRALPQRCSGRSARLLLLASGAPFWNFANPC